MKATWTKRLLSLHGFLFLFFVYAPIMVVVVYSFNSHPVNMMVWKEFTFDWYWSIFGYPTKLNEQTLYVESTDQLLAAVCRRIRRSESSFLTDFALYLALLLLARCGMRISEPLRLMKGHYRKDDGTVYIEKTKFKKDRLIPLPIAVITEIDNYLCVRSHLLTGAPSSSSCPLPQNTMGSKSSPSDWSTSAYS